jgi:hypothetical protein
VLVDATGFEPVTPSVSGHARPFARSVAALHGTTSALLRRVTEPGTAVRREAAYGIAADKLLTVGRELHTAANCIPSGEHQFERGDRWLIAARSAARLLGH